jgi:hypothetical protein
VSGQHFGGTGYQLDGTDNRDPILGIIVINPTLESVGEFKVTSQNYDAEFGQAIAGVVSVHTRSGANELRGSAFEFLQRDRFQARNPFTQFQADPVTGRYIPETKRDQFGGSLGGRAEPGIDGITPRRSARPGAPSAARRWAPSGTCPATPYARHGEASIGKDASPPGLAARLVLGAASRPQPTRFGHRCALNGESTRVGRAPAARVGVVTSDLHAGSERR